MTRIFPVVMALLSVGSISAFGADPDPLPILPKEYAAYEIDPDTISPNGQYGLMYLSAAPDDEKTEIKNFVVALKPFRVVVELPKSDNAFFAGESHADFAVNWAKDSSVVVVGQGSRWGPGSVFAVPLQDGKAGKIAELASEVRKFAEPDFKKAKAEPYNDVYGFVFVGDYSWPVNDKKQVVVSVDCATNPKGDPDTKSWKGHFEGLWDIAQGKFVTHEFKRTFSGMYPEQ